MASVAQIKKLTGEFDVLNVTSLTAAACGITSLDAVAACENCEHLDIQNNEIECLGPLRKLEYLKSLDASNNTISNVSGLTGFQYLVQQPLTP